MVKEKAREPLYYVLNQMIAYIEERARLGATGSGFRKGYSTTTVLLGIRDALIRASKK